MKQFIQTICIFTLIAGVLIAGPRYRTKAEFRQDAMRDNYSPVFGKKEEATVEE